MAPSAPKAFVWRKTLGDIKSLLAAYGLHPKKRFGQNFLHDANHMQRIIDAAAIEPGDRVLEVGPGTGALTERLLDAAARVVAVEVDSDMAPILAERTTDAGDRFTLIVGDVMDGKRALSADVTAVLRDEPFKMVANLPYNVASPLIATLVCDLPNMSRAVVMIQREVADRLVAPPGGKDYGPLGILVQAMCEVEKVGVLSPACFWPQPQVESAVVLLTRRDEPLTRDPHRLGELLHRLFSKRRKTTRRDSRPRGGAAAGHRPVGPARDALAGTTCRPRRFTALMAHSRGPNIDGAATRRILPQTRRSEGDSSMKTLVAIPVFNEEKYVTDVLQKVRQYASDILVIDDGSSDQTPLLLAKQPVEVIRHAENRGYGQSMIDAFRWAQCYGFDWLITMDCDEQHEPESLPDFERAIREHCVDVISGSRYHPDSPADDHPPEDRRAINKTITEIINDRLDLNLTDAFCGFKAYRVDAVRKLPLTERGYAFPAAVLGAGRGE